jgi:hypothetical protein
MPRRATEVVLYEKTILQRDWVTNFTISDASSSGVLSSVTLRLD